MQTNSSKFHQANFPQNAVEILEDVLKHSNRKIHNLSQKCKVVNFQGNQTEI